MLDRKWYPLPDGEGFPHIPHPMGVKNPHEVNNFPYFASQKSIFQLEEKWFSDSESARRTLSDSIFKQFLTTPPPPPPAHPVPSYLPKYKNAYNFFIFQLEEKRFSDSESARQTLLERILTQVFDPPSPPAGPPSSLLLIIKKIITSARNVVKIGATACWIGNGTLY